MRTRILLSLLLLFAVSAGAQPQPPHQVYGTVTDSGVAVEGVNVSAVVDGSVVASDLTSSEGYYEVEITASYEGETASFLIDGEDTGKQVNVSSGRSDEVDFEGDYISDGGEDGTTTENGGEGGGPVNGTAEEPETVNETETNETETNETEKEPSPELKMLDLTVKTNESAIIAEARFKNTGDAPADKEVPMLVDGEEADSTTIRLEPGETTAAVLQEDVEPGTYSVTVWGETRRATVEEDIQPFIGRFFENATSPEALALVILALVAAAFAVYIT